MKLSYSNDETVIFDQLGNKDLRNDNFVNDVHSSELKHDRNMKSEQTLVKLANIYKELTKGEIIHSNVRKLRGRGYFSLSFIYQRCVLNQTIIKEKHYTVQLEKEDFLPTKYPK